MGTSGFATPPSSRVAPDPRTPLTADLHRRVGPLGRSVDIQERARVGTAVPKLFSGRSPAGSGCCAASRARSMLVHLLRDDECVLFDRAKAPGARINTGGRTFFAGQFPCIV
eukprot:4789845-Alexandrium_andersonii.AAC.1